MKQRNPWGLGLICCLSLVGPAAAEDVVTVRLKASASAPDRRVSLEDVAALEGGTLGLRHRIGRLDVGELPADQAMLEVTAGQVVFRIQLAGVEKDRFRVVGAERTRVRLARTEIGEEEILATAEQYVRQRLPNQGADATIRVAKAATGSVVVDADRADLRLEADSRVNGVPLGRVQVDVGVLVGGIKRRSLPVILEVKVQQTVAVASRRIDAGQVLDATNVRQEVRTVDHFHQFATTAETLLGKRARQAILPGQTVTLRDVEMDQPSTVPAANSVLIKQRDRVRLMARLGNDYVTATGEALQDGREGQLIQVRNSETKKQVVGRVVGRGMVEVEY